MSKHRPEIDFNPLLRKVQDDINLLCYLGLHQYAKDNKLIGRSRPMITPELDFLMQKRLNFRLVVACIQQIVGNKTYQLGDREEQINYVNVGEYSVLRLYGFLDKDIFSIKTTDRSTLTSWWPEQFAIGDRERLRSPAPLETFHDDLSYNARACLEIGGEIFTNHLRNALKYIPMDLIEFKPHAQRDPKNRMSVKNIAVPLRLVEQKQFGRMRHLIRTRDAVPSPNTVFIPTHIEQLLHFRHVLWPWIQSLQTTNVREAFRYVADNFPSLHAIQMKIRSIRESTAERERRERLLEEDNTRREEAREQLRTRLVATYGEPVPVEEQAIDHEVGGDHIHIDNTPRGYHGMELEAPGAAFDRRLEAQFIEEGEQVPLPDPPEFGFVEQEGGTVVLPVPDMHHGMDETIAEQANDITDRLRRALGMPEEEE